MKLSVSVLCGVIIVLLASVSTPLLASQTATDLNSEDAKSIKAIIDGTWQALQKKDMDNFKQYCTSDWVLFSSKGTRLNADKLFEMYNANITDFKLDASELNIHVAGDMAYATYDAKITGKIQGKPWQEDYIFTNIFQKENGKWMGVHTHQSKK